MGVWIEILQSKDFPPEMLSLPAWECGLKYELEIFDTLQQMVTPCVGVWIEIEGYEYYLNKLRSLPAWECGLKLKQPIMSAVKISHSLRGSVD